jgi:hypothetical protein
LICIRAPRVRRSDASGARSRGADAAHAADQLDDLPKAGEDADDEDERDEPVEPGVRLEHRQDLRQGQKRTQPRQAQHEQHCQNLPNRL